MLGQQLGEASETVTGVRGPLRPQGADSEIGVAFRGRGGFAGPNTTTIPPFFGKIPILGA